MQNKGANDGLSEKHNILSGFSQENEDTDGNQAEAVAGWQACTQAGAGKNIFLCGKGRPAQEPAFAQMGAGCFQGEGAYSAHAGANRPEPAFTGKHD